MISVVIPTHNAGGNIKHLLDSIYASEFKDFEVLVIDDKSTDGSIDALASYPVRLIKLEENKGPANARNTGASLAEGDLLFFLDSDVTIPIDALESIDSSFKKDQNVKALIGIWDKHPVNRGFAPEYKALLCHWSFQFHKGKTFETAFGVIRKDVFNEMGGFSTGYRNADVEDYEFSRRLSRKCKIHLDMKLVIKHNFPSLAVGVKKYFLRSFHWTRLFLKDRQFDDVMTTPSLGIGTLSAFFSFSIVPSLVVFPMAKYLFLPALLAYLFAYSGFFTFVLREKGLMFTLRVILMSYFLCIVMGCGALYSVLSLPVRKTTG